VTYEGASGTTTEAWFEDPIGLSKNYPHITQFSPEYWFEHHLLPYLMAYFAALGACIKAPSRRKAQRKRKKISEYHKSLMRYHAEREAFEEREARHAIRARDALDAQERERFQRLREERHLAAEMRRYSSAAALRATVLNYNNPDD
jgi:hypothetical protein